MNWHKVHLRADDMSDSLQLDEACLEGLHRRDFKQGTLVKDWRGEGWLRCTDPDYDGTPDDVLATANMLPVYSSRLQTAIRDEGITGFQFLPVKVFSPSRGEIGGYSIANVLNLVDALDLEKSSFMVFDNSFDEQLRGKIKWVSEMVLKAELLREVDVLWIKQYPVAMCASERFVSMFKRGNFSGIKFSKRLRLS